MNWIEALLRRRRWVLLGTLLLSLAAAWFIPGMESEDTYDGWFAPDDPDYRFYKDFQRRFANDMFFIVVFKDEPLFTPSNLALIASLTVQLEQVPYVRQVTSLTNVEYLYGQQDRLVVEPLVQGLEAPNAEAIRQRARSKPMYRDALISADGATTAILGELEKVASMSEEMAAVSTIQSIMRQAEAESGKQLYLGGYLAMDVEIMQASERDVLKFIPLTIGVIFLVLWFTFRHWLPAALSFAAVVIALVWTFGLYAGLENPYSMMTSILPVVLIAIGIADSVHILIHYYEELSYGLDRFQAIKMTLRKMLRPCLFTSLTTAVGFISFLASDIPIVRLTGLYAAVGIGFAFMLSVVALPALLSFFRAPQRAARQQAAGRLVAFLDRLTGWTLDHPRAILVGMSLLVLIGAWGALRLSTDTTMLTMLKDDHPLRVDYAFIEENLTGLSNLELVVEGRADALRQPALLNQLDALSRFAQSRPHVRKTLSLVDYAKEINQALHGGDPAFYRIPETPQAVAQSLLLYEFAGGKELRDYVTADYRSGRLTVLFDTVSSGQAASLRRSIADYAQTQLGLPLQTTGTIALVEQMMDKVALSQTKSIAIALGLIALLMGLLLRSVKLGLISMIPNALPILLMFAVMGFAGIPLDAVTSIVAGLALSIAVDDTIHYLTRFRRELGRLGDYRQALRRTTHTLGQAIVSTSVILLAGFSVLLLGSFQGTMYFGLLIGLTMLFALAGDLVLLPALLLWLKPIRVEQQVALVPFRVGAQDYGQGRR